MQQELNLYQTYQQQIAEYDTALAGPFANPRGQGGTGQSTTCEGQAANVDKGMKYSEEKYREHEIRSIQKKANDLGLGITLATGA
ncbi:MAG: hypothetical protein WB762_32230 [Candidatus Sulfotelmatobacter sp.]